MRWSLTTIKQTMNEAFNYTLQTCYFCSNLNEKFDYLGWAEDNKHHNLVFTKNIVFCYQKVTQQLQSKPV